MLEFFKVLSGVTASIISIVFAFLFFAFLLSKIISFEEKSNDIIEKIENRLIELNEIKIDIKSMGISQGEYGDSENEIFERYFEIILDIDEESDKNIVMCILKEKEIFFITVNKIMGKLEERKKEWCKESLREIVNFIEKNNFSSISDVYKNIEDSFKSTKLIKKLLPEEYSLSIRNAFINSQKNKNSYFLHNNHFNYLENLNLTKNYQSYRKDKIKAMIDKYEIKISSLKNEEKYAKITIIVPHFIMVYELYPNEKIDVPSSEELKIGNIIFKKNSCISKYLINYIFNRVKEDLEKGRASLSNNQILNILKRVENISDKDTGN